MTTFHSDELYEIGMYGSNRYGIRTTAYTDLIISSTINNTDHIYLASISGSPSKVEQIAWLFNDGNKTAEIHRAEGYRFDKNHKRIRAFTETKKKKYTVHTQRIDDISHALIVSKSIEEKTSERFQWIETNGHPAPGQKLPHDLAEFIIAWDGDMYSQIYKILNDRYGTPMIEEWKEYIVDEMIENEYFEYLSVYTFGNESPIQAGLLRVTDEQLENIITNGIQSYELDFALLEDDTQEEVLSKLESIDQYLSHFAGDLAECIQQNIALRFDPHKDRHSPAFKDVNLTANQNGITGLFPPQADTVMGVANTLKEDDYCFIVGEMGAGKTPLGMVAPYVTQSVRSHDGSVKPYRALVFSPSIMVEKWKREIKERIPNCEVYEIAHYTDVLKLKNQPYRPNKIEYYVMNSDLPKYTYPMLPIKDWRYSSEDAKAYYSQYKADFNENGVFEDKPPRVRFEKESHFANGYEQTVLAPTETGYHCPECGGVLYEKKDVPSGQRFFEQRSGRKWTPRVRKSVNYVCQNAVPVKTLPKHKVKDKNAETQKCGYVLWEPEKLEADSKKRKVSPAWAINKFLRRGFFQYLIADEVHEYKSGDSSIAQAFGQLINHTEKQILLTGTLMGGMASDIFYLLARLDPSRLLKEGIRYSDESLFTKKYGVFEKKYVGDDDNRRQSGSAKKPGLSPHLFPRYLMRNCAFLELSDLGYALPPYREEPIFIEMDNEHRIEYDRLDQHMTSLIGTNAFSGSGMKYVSTYINLMSQYSDLPFNIPEINSFDDLGNDYVIATPHSFEADSFVPAKFQRMLRDIDEEVYTKNRKCLVYTKFTGANSFNATDSYIYEKLKELGYNVGILKSSGTYDGIRMPKSSKDRERWLKEMMEKNDWDVLVTNPKLVKVGLDLLMFPNIMYYQLDYSTYDYMQSSRRSWRIKQTEDVIVRTYSYRNTIQDQVLEHIATKIDSAMAMQGKFSEEGLRSMADSNDGFQSLAKKLLSEGKLDNVDTIHERFQRLNHSYEELQSTNYEDYEFYDVNPIEGGMETVKKIAQGLIKEFEDKVSAGTATVQELAAYMEKFDEMMQVIDDVKSYNKGKRKKEQVIEGQVALALF
ncbi:DEAD/DEAH box helicase [Oceanobacillus profundus]|uniref:DEAD/DEAH box helicase n=1 Tax=Oceanobacillus profundus TaxID=372463 RepID=A0A417YGK2_9BACI|nr:DEAD/DEAH box helicase [Oceanobacillus profundus]RHW31882.1 DEAD/DEAH box helicase [Oceanobacillus profundus]